MTYSGATLEEIVLALPSAVEIVAAMDADPPSVNVTLWQGDVPQFLDGGAVVASVSSVGSVSGVVNANVVQYNNQWMYYGVVSGVSGNVITTTGLKTNPDGTVLADDKLIALVGWQVMFYHQIAGYPSTDVFWRATIVSYTESTITVDAMPADNLASGGFSVYILPPAFGASSAIDGQDVADALLLAPAGVAAAGSAMDYLADIVEDTGTTLPGLITGTSTGARTIVITVNDGTDPLENARVRLTEGVNTIVGSTGVNGQVTFNRDDATYTVAITKAGYTFAGTSLTIDGNETQTYSMTAISFSASEPGQSTGWVYCYDDEGNVEADVSISVQLTATPETDSYAFDTVIRVVASEVDGLAEFTGLWIGATYRARRYNGPWYSFVVPNAVSFALPVLLGR